MSNSMIIKGRAGSDGEVRFTPSGVASCSFSVADTPRKKDQSGQWVDAGPTLWQRVQVWGPEAEKAGEEVRKGALVTVSGRVRADEWQDKQTGETRKSTTLVADVVYVHPPKDQQARPQQQAQQDPWGSQPQQQGFGGDNDDQPPF
ncbi:single-stranded DNA-binding protein [Dietzia sp. ANT_WB102]|uniref:single-stranded DNA-binding protein n=1 Tax=Dietzia sp. ANT_WB102 TaxID=2597345 RepID=UPI0011ED036D|nr:single-stranded DNA-binding protein [Dietzia sp. ANT_WB102]KAA0916444.1 single-stranded DNA-binding protein [Dietzia sp. ANT_WB102]